MDAFLIFEFEEGPSVWTDKNRAKYNRDHLRYPSDLTDSELRVRAWNCIAGGCGVRGRRTAFKIREDSGAAATSRR